MREFFYFRFPSLKKNTQKSCKIKKVFIFAQANGSYAALGRED